MVIILFLLIVAAGAILIAFPAPREKTIEYLKVASDRVVLWILWKTSGFGRELTRDGQKEQRLWREQRLRNLTGLAIRSKQRFGEEQN